MKHVLYLLLILVSFGSCKKEQVAAQNPDFESGSIPKIISSDTLTSGQWWGLNISDTITDVYKTIQLIQDPKKINYLGIVGDGLIKIEDLEYTIPLYTSIFLDERIGTESGIQIHFAYNKVKSIHTNSGTELSRWPLNTANVATISKNDPIENIYSSLINIKNIAAYANKFERISLFDKDLTKAYDVQMSKSPQWHFSATVNDKRYYVVHLNFSSGLLTSIYTTLYETY